MNIRFPFPISYIDSNTISIDTILDSQPLVTIDIHPDLQEYITDDQHKKIHNKVLCSVIKHSMVIK